MAKNKQPSLFSTLEKIEKSISTIRELRVPIFAPISQVSKNSVAFREFEANGQRRTVKTSWGSAEIQNRILTQTHKDLLDCIFAYARSVEELENGRIALTFSTLEILEKYGVKGKNTLWFEQKMIELRGAVIEYRYNNGEKEDFNIITSKLSRDLSKPGPNGKKDRIVGIVLDERYVKFYEKGLSIDYKKELPELLKIDSSILKAVIRFFFTQKVGAMIGVENLLQTIGFPMESIRWVQSAKKEFKENVGTLKKFGINYNHLEKMFTYTGNENVYFIPASTINILPPKKG